MILHVDSVKSWIVYCIHLYTHCHSVTRETRGKALEHTWSAIHHGLYRWLACPKLRKKMHWWSLEQEPLELQKASGFEGAVHLQRQLIVNPQLMQ